MTNITDDIINLRVINNNVLIEVSKSDLNDTISKVGSIYVASQHHSIVKTITANVIMCSKSSKYYSSLVNGSVILLQRYILRDASTLVHSTDTHNYYIIRDIDIACVVE